MREFTYGEFRWKIDKKGEVQGPFCPKCKGKAEMTFIGGKPLANAEKYLYGEEIKYTYKCKNKKCYHKVKKNTRLDELKEQAKEEYEERYRKN